MQEVLLIATAMLWFSVPFIPAIRELRRPQDDIPLEVYQGNLADLTEPLHEAFEFAAKNPQATAADMLQGTKVLPLSTKDAKETRIQARIADALWFTDDVFLKALPDNVKAVNGKGLVLASNFSSEATISASDRAILCNNVEIRAIQASLIQAGATTKLKDAAIDVSTLTPTKALNGLNGAVWCEAQNWWSSPKTLVLPNNVFIQGDVVSGGDVTVGENTVVTGSIKSNGHLTLGENARVLGNCVGNSVDINAGALVKGCVVADWHVELKEFAQVGTLECSASVVGTTIALVGGSAVFGGISAHKSIKTI